MNSRNENGAADSVRARDLGAYGVRYSRACGIICGFSLVEPERLVRAFLMGRAVEAGGSEPFCHLAADEGKTG